MTPHSRQAAQSGFCKVPISQLLSQLLSKAVNQAESCVALHFEDFHNDKMGACDSEIAFTQSVKCLSPSGISLALCFQEHLP